jgi:hypothetical protein
VLNRLRWFRRASNATDPGEVMAQHFARHGAVITVDSTGQPTVDDVALTLSKVRTGRYKLATGNADHVLTALQGWLNDGTEDYYLNTEDALGAASGELFLNVKRELLPTENDLTVSRTTQRIPYIKNSTDSAANTTIAERPIAHVMANAIVTEIVFTPDESAAGHASNFGTLTFSSRDRGGGANTLGSWSTATSAQGSLVARQSASFSLGSATARQLFSGSVITFAQTKSGSGVVLPSGTFTIFITLFNRFDGILGVVPNKEWQKEEADALAADVLAEKPVWRVAVPCSLTTGRAIPGANVTANGSNYGTWILSKYDNAGANKVTLGTLDTSTTGLTAWVARTFSLASPTETKRLRAGDVISFEQTKTGTGVLLPTAGFELTLAVLTFGFPSFVAKDSDDSAAGDAITEFPVFIAPEARTLSSVWYQGNAAIAADASNYATQIVSKRDGAGGGATALASHSTQTGAEGATSTNVPALFTNAVTAVAVGNIVTYKSTKTGTGAIIRAGSVAIYFSAETIKTDRWIHYADDALASDVLTQREFFSPKRVSPISALKICLKTTIPADATDYVVFTVKRKDAFGNCVETVATWSTQTGQQGAITAMVPVSMVLSGDSNVLSLPPGDVLSIEYTKGGAGQIVSQGVVQVDYTQPEIRDVPADPISRTISLEYDIKQ